MDIKDIILQVMPMTDNMAGKVLKNVFKAVSNGEGFSTNLFSKVIDELNNKTVTKRLNVIPKIRRFREQSFLISDNRSVRFF